VEVVINLLYSQKYVEEYLLSKGLILS